MNQNLIAALIQVAGIALCPLLPGFIQNLKARLQGRRGSSILQPYRELRRLWKKSSVDPAGSGVVYRSAPAVVAACLVLAVLMIPIAGISSPWGLGDDALLLVGLLALARFAIAASAWDTGGGFGLMGASRDLMLAVFIEGLLLAVLTVTALASGSTGLAAMSIATAGVKIWSAPLQWCVLAAFALIAVSETGRQPVDNPDTHLELTMIHEGPLLEYAGRDLALLQWAAAARHWIVLVLGAAIFLPHPSGFAAQLIYLPAALAISCGALAVMETWLAKMRILWVPRWLAGGGLLCIIGMATWLAGARP